MSIRLRCLVVGLVVACWACSSDDGETAQTATDDGRPDAMAMSSVDSGQGALDLDSPSLLTVRMEVVEQVRQDGRVLVRPLSGVDVRVHEQPRIPAVETQTPLPAQKG